MSAFSKSVDSQAISESPATSSSFESRISKRGWLKSQSRHVVGSVRTKLTGVWQVWCKFWFTPSDPFTLGALRWFVAGMLLYSHLVWGLALEDFFGSTGWNNQGVIEALQADSYAWSFWWFVSDTWLFPVHVVCTAIIFLFWIGFATRLTGPAAWVIGVSYAQRSMLANFGLDQIICSLTLYLAIAPSGQCLSVDSWIRKRRKGVDVETRRSVMATVSSRLIQIHLCVMYFFAGTAKLQGESWWNGSAVWQTIANFEYQSFDLTFLAGYPLVTEVATTMTVLWELSFAALVWNKSLRPWVLVIGISMHLGIGMFLGMWTFGLAMMFGYLTFVRPQYLRWLLSGDWRAARRSQLQAPQLLADIQEPADQPARADKPAPAFEFTSTGEPIEIPRETRVTGIVVVAKSYRLGDQIRRYLCRLHASVCLVDGMVHAQKLSELSGNQLVICLLHELNEAEISHWFTQIRSSNPHVSMVFVSNHTPEICQHDGYTIVPSNVTLRGIRLSAESLLGHELVRSPKSSAKRTMSSRMRVARSVVGIAIMLSVVGCGSREESPTKLLERAGMLNDRGRYDEALQLISQVSQMDPGNADAYYLEGVAHEQLGQLEPAIDSYSQCLTNEPRHTDSLNNRGVVLGRLGRLDEAVADLKQAIEHHPDDDVAWANLGLAYHEQGKLQDAIESYDRGVELTSGSAQLYFQRGNASLAQGDFTAAIADYGDAIDKQPGFARAYLNRAMAHLRSGQSDKGNQDLDLAQQHDDDMTISPIIMNVRPSFAAVDVQSRAAARVREWLESSGWETQPGPKPYDFAASRIPVPTAGNDSDPPRFPEEFTAVVLVADSLDKVYGDFKKISTAVEDESPHCLFVIDPTEMSNPSALADGHPRWLLHADSAWKPVRNSFQPYQVRLVLPENSTKTASQ